MTDEQRTPMRNLYSAQNRTSYMHVAEAFAIEKFGIRIGNRKDGKSTGDNRCYLDIHMARAIFHHMFITGKVLDGKQTVFGGSKAGPISRILNIEEDMREGRNNPIVFKISVGPGVFTKTGGISPDPKKKSEIVNTYIMMDRTSARTMAGACLAALAAYEAASWTIMLSGGNAQPVGHRPPQEPQMHEVPDDPDHEPNPSLVPDASAATIMYEPAREDTITELLTALDSEHNSNGDAINDEIEKVMAHAGVATLQDLTEKRVQNWLKSLADRAFSRNANRNGAAPPPAPTPQAPPPPQAQSQPQEEEIIVPF